MKYAAPKVPCGSCPYRCDVPPGIWHADEYAKLPGYDGPTWGQSLSIFLCHQNDGKLCGGWLACHGPSELLALRLVAAADAVDPAVWEYDPGVPVFSSGREAAAHGLSGVAEPPVAAIRKMVGLQKQRRRKS